MTMQYTDANGYLVTRLGPGNVFGDVAIREAPGGKGPYQWGTEGSESSWKLIPKEMYYDMLRDVKATWPVPPEPKPAPKKDSTRIPPIAWVGVVALIAGVYAFIKLAHAAGFY